jgi:hypothetical protein
MGKEKPRMKVIYWKIKNGKVSDIETLQSRFLEVGIPVTFVLLTQNHVHAAANVKQAMKPIIDTLKDLAEPVTYAFMIFGGLKYASGHSAEGGKIIKNAIGGYILVQWIPWIFSIIRQVGAQG